LTRRPRAAGWGATEVVYSAPDHAYIASHETTRAARVRPRRRQEPIMRPEAEKLVIEIKESLSVLRRHL